MKKTLFLLVCLISVSLFAHDDFLNQVFAEKPQAVAKIIACEAINPELTDTIITLPTPTESQSEHERSFNTEAILPYLLLEGQNASSTTYNMKSSKSQYFETYAIFIRYDQGYSFHVADYYDGTRVVTSLDGPLQGHQLVGVNGIITADSSNIKCYSNYCVHYYVGGKITTYPNRQVIEIY